ncbi:MAG TPA: DNA-directed RNA polymerase subunit P [Thermoproteales archaeon]|nr:DNA-directed RNA polymerase subunit P [Thermoproteales archaeon]
MSARDWKPYICLKCGKMFSLEEVVLIEERGVIRCPYCGSRIVAKTRPPVAKRVKVI